MLLQTFFESVELHRDDKFVSLRFRRPFRVISTSRANGGIADDLDLVFNHQSCEPAGHQSEGLLKAHREPDTYSAFLIAGHGLEGKAAAGLGTAANMNNLCVAEEEFRELRVAAVATGGVETNAARAGDPASHYEIDGRFEPCGGVKPPAHGTINVMVCINRTLAEGALVRAVMTATEAKSAVLQELSAPSRYSPQIATGTGTDQIAIAAPADGNVPLTSAGHHSVLGELIGKVVHRAIKDTLALQNGLTPASRCSCNVLLDRFGVASGTLMDRVAGLLAPDMAALARRNALALDHDPLTVAAVAALVHLHDQMVWGVLPASCWPEIAVAQGALIAAAMAGRPDYYERYRDRLAADGAATQTRDPVAMAVAAIALGFTDKWTRTAEMLTAVTGAIGGGA
jgi:adenosylcobinamide amidohydrolase